MQTFLDRHREKIVGVLSGFDRILFRGTWRCLEYQKGVEDFLAMHRVLYKDFGAFAQRLSDEVKAHAKALPRKKPSWFTLLPEGQFHLQGFRNKVAGKITLLFRLLRAHRLIRKVAKTFYYRLTPQGHQIMSTALQPRTQPVRPRSLKSLLSKQAYSGVLCAFRG